MTKQQLAEAICQRRIHSSLEVGTITQQDVPETLTRLRSDTYDDIIESDLPCVCCGESHIPEEQVPVLIEAAKNLQEWELILDRHCPDFIYQRAASNAEHNTN